MSGDFRFVKVVRLLAMSAMVALPVGTALVTTSAPAHAGPAGYGAPPVDPRLDGVPAPSEAAAAPRYGYLNDRELRAEAALLRTKAQEVRNAQAALAMEFARRGESPIATRPTE